MDAKGAERRPPMKANFISAMLFSWLDPLMKKGFKKTLSVDDLFAISDENKSQYIYEDLDREWQKELARVDRGLRPSYLRAILRCFWRSLVVLGLATGVAEVSKVFQPLFLAQMLHYFTAADDGSGNAKLYTYLYALATIGTLVVISAATQPFEFFNFVVGMRMRVGSCALIYRKTLRLSQRALADSTTGHIVNLMSTDAVRFDYAPGFLHYLWLAPIETAAVLAILWMDIGVASLPGFTLVLVIIPLQGYMGKLFTKLRLKMASRTDERLQVMDQVLAGIKVIKLYCWEKPFSDLVLATRRREMKLVKIVNYLTVLSTEIGYFTFAKVAIGACVLTWTQVHGTLPSLDTVVILMRLISTIQDSLVYYLPLSVQVWGEIITTCSRIQEFLLLEELHVRHIRSCGENDIANVKLNAYCGKWGGSESVAVKDITLSTAAGELLAVVGPVGSGKSSLLMAILGELPCVSGDLAVVGRVAYAAQQPWIFSASVQQNVVFGRDYDADRYRAVIEACALDKDLSLLPDGDQTLVGERGVMLSGGQKARISLARAVYQDADVYVLDDPLSAIDAAVARHVFERCIKGMLTDRLCLLVTHQLLYAYEAKLILLVNEGSVKALGSGSDMQLLDIALNEPTTSADDSLSLMPCSAAHLRARNMESLHSKSAQVQLNASSAPHSRRSALLSTSDPCLVAAEDGETEQNPPVQLDKRSDKLGSSTGQLEIDGYADAQTPLKTDQDSDSAFEQAENEPEQVAHGRVKWAVYKQYFTAGTNKIVLAMLALLMVSGQAGFVVIDWFLTERAYVRDQLDHSISVATNETLDAILHANGTWDNGNLAFSNATIRNGSYTGAMGVELSFFFYVYTGLTVGVVILSIARALLFYKVCFRASSRLHDKMLMSVLHSPMRFFDTNPAGRILNRFSSDVTYVDNFLPVYCYDLAVVLMTIGGTVVMVAIANPWLLILLLPSAAMLAYVRKVYAATSRAVKRLEAIARSPVLSHVSATIAGIFTIRAVNSQKMFCRAFCSIQDGHTDAYYILLSVNRWLAVRMDALCIAFVSSVILLCIVAKDSVGLDPNVFALTITYGVSMTVVFQYVVRQSIDVENMMTSVERIIDYSKLPAEGASVAVATKPPAGWPSEGRLQASDVGLRYYEGGPQVLQSMNFCIRGGEKVGVCGRTGAGKSSLLAMLFRLCEPTGSFTIDDVRIADIELPSLRSSVSIIPQEPVLFIGTVRSNLDPFSEHSDNALWDVLREVQLSVAIQNLPGGLEAAVKEAGANFSVGQRQLLCLARALLRNTKIVVVDEATASVDPTTSATIQETIKNKFRSRTVLTIAHRLDSVMESDRIMVLDGGCIREFDEPHLLLLQPDSLLKALVRYSGKDSEKLFELAKDAYDKRHSGL